MWYELIWIEKKHMDKSLFEGFLWSVKLCVAEGEKTNSHHLQRERKVECSYANAHRTFHTIRKSRNITGQNRSPNFLLCGSSNVVVWEKNKNPARVSFLGLI